MVSRSSIFGARNAMLVGIISVLIGLAVGGLVGLVAGYLGAPCDVNGLPSRRLHQLRQQMQAVFRDPLGSLNPRMTIGQLVGEPLRVFGTVARSQVHAPGRRAAAHGRDRPHQGGRAPPRAVGRPPPARRHRTRDLRHPRFIVADEPVSARDVSVQAQILNLLVELQERLGLTYLFIAHGLAVVRHMSRRVGVMYLGRMVELATSEAIFAHPAHPYTAALLAAAPVPDPDQRQRRVMLAGELPRRTSPPSAASGPGCPMAQSRCADEEPRLRRIGPGQWAACHFAGAAGPAAG